MTHRPLAALVALLAAACSPSVRVRVLEPALVDVPPDVRTVVVIDRSRPANTAQDVLGTLEGLATGESVLQDREGARRAVDGLADALAASPRFDVVVPRLDRRTVESNLWDRELTWATAKRIAREHDAQAIVALEAFDSDSLVELTWRTEERTVEGRKVRETVHVATRDTRVVAAWRLYDVQSERVIDDLRDLPRAGAWSREAPTPEAAVRSLPSGVDTVLGLGWETGSLYGRRIAPSYAWVSRTYYGRRELAPGKHAARAGDWEAAHEAWSAVANEGPTAKIRGKASMDVALALEVLGDLDDAVAWATEAAKLHPKPRTRRYAAELRRRAASQRRAEDQLAVPPPDPGPLAVPSG